MRIWNSCEYLTNWNYGTHTVEEMQVPVSNYKPIKYTRDIKHCVLHKQDS